MAQTDLRALQDTEFPVPAELQANIAITSLDKIYNWSRRSSMWPMLFGLACCAIEMIGTAASRFDFSRFGFEVMRGSPRQSDLMIVSGTVTKKMIVPIVRLYNQMPEPKYVLAMGACASGGGPFKEGYNVVSGVDKYLPVDVYVPGCPPTPQALLHGMIALQKKIDGQSLANLDDVPMVWCWASRADAGADFGAGRYRSAPNGAHPAAGATGRTGCALRRTPVARLAESG